MFLKVLKKFLYGSASQEYEQFTKLQTRRVKCVFQERYFLLPKLKDRMESHTVDKLNKLVQSQMLSISSKA
jgi:hypothetical protein